MSDHQLHQVGSHLFVGGASIAIHADTPVEHNIATPEPVFATPEPVFATPEPVFATPEPVFATPEPVVATPEPIVATPSSVVVPRVQIIPSTDNRLKRHINHDPRSRKFAFKTAG
jgi:hypothetical protein